MKVLRPVLVSALRYIIRFRIQRKIIQRKTIFCEPIIRENVGHGSALKKSNFLFSEKKRTPAALILQRLKTRKLKNFC